MNNNLEIGDGIVDMHGENGSCSNILKGIYFRDANDKTWKIVSKVEFQSPAFSVTIAATVTDMTNRPYLYVDGALVVVHVPIVGGEWIVMYSLGNIRCGIAALREVKK